ncbi:MAG TPA: lysylphosphatidylglycerol synthase transmembrane domain-containing protein, partial [Candidatus Eremiobacteraceae bacterium]|nr:lysylphosphatidylglycerol synthase transmembrane domain-containing protein [Candidatus Eremiobacteraceae bacterium]
MKGTHQPAKTARGWFLIALRWAAAFLVLAGLFRFLPFSTLRIAIAKIPPARFFIVLVLYLCAHCIGVLKWRMVVNAAGAALDLATSAQCYFGGLFGTLFLPSIVGGDVVRLAVGLRKSPRPAAVLAGNVVDRFLDVAAQAGLVLAGLLLLPGSLSQAWQIRMTHYFLFLILGALICIVLLFVGFRSIVACGSWKLRRHIVRLRHALSSMKRRPFLLIAGWFAGTMIQFTFLVLTALLAISCGLTLPLRVWLFAWPLAKLVAVLPITQGGIGVREAALVALLAPFGAPGALVLAAGLVWEGIIIVG